MADRRPRPSEDERGASAIELVLYAPLVMLITFLVIQAAMIYFGNEVASAVARETARVARVTHDGGRAQASGYNFANQIGDGVLEGVRIKVASGGEGVRVTVTGEATKISPIPIPRVSQTVEGPIEEFKPE